MGLAPYGMHSADSAGRRHAEDDDRFRTCWERDRDRVVHCTAFRRLLYKTQVFVNWKGDHYRTRLSHSLEVAQVARSLGSALGLNEPLCEALALAHDIGHPPFGHRGEAVLDERMRDHGGFRHNAQVLRVVDRLERRSPDYPGLNLTRELRESLLKHESDADWPDDLKPRPRWPCLEAQVVDLADSTAYNVHDIDDGLRSGLFDEAELRAGSALWRRACDAVSARHPGFLADSKDKSLRTKLATNELVGLCINDLIEHSSRRLAEVAPRDPSAVRAAEHMFIRHGPEFRTEVAELHAFLYERFYRHPELLALTERAAGMLTPLFDAYERAPQELPRSFREWIDAVGLQRSICDYVAGMTDRFAREEFERLCAPA